MAIGKRPNRTPSAINLESEEAKNFILSGTQDEAIKKSVEENSESPVVKEVAKSRKETKIKEDAGDKKVRFYHLPIPDEVYDGIEEYIFKNRKTQKVTIKGFIIDAIKEKIEREL